MQPFRLALSPEADGVSEAGGQSPSVTAANALVAQVNELSAVLDWGDRKDALPLALGLKELMDNQGVPEGNKVGEGPGLRLESPTTTLTQALKSGDEAAVRRAMLALRNEL